MRLTASLTGVTLAAVLGASAGQTASKTPVETIRLADDYAACLVRNRHDVAAMAILSNADNSEILDRYPRLIDSSCLNSTGGLRFKADAFRYSLANALVRADLANVSLNDLGDVLPLQHLIVQPELPEDVDLKTLSRKARADHAEKVRSFTKAATISYMSQYGECVVRANPDGVKQVLLAKVATPEERARLQALMPSLSGCMPQGRSLTFSPVVLRGSLAINYYRLAHAPRQSQTQGHKI